MLLIKLHFIRPPQQARLAIKQVVEGVMVHKEDGVPGFASNNPLDIEHLTGLEDCKCSQLDYVRM